MDTPNIVHPPETVNIRGRVSIITPIGENMVDVQDTSPPWKKACRSKSPSGRFKVSITISSKSPDGKAAVSITPSR